jgi:hypothetical protein
MDGTRVRSHTKGMKYFIVLLTFFGFSVQAAASGDVGAITPPAKPIIVKKSAVSKPPRPYVEKEAVTEASPPQEVICDGCDLPIPQNGYLTEAQAESYYGSYSPSQIPNGTVFNFSEWVIPPDSKCTTNKTLDAQPTKNTCIACSDHVDPERHARELETLELAGISAKNDPAQTVIYSFHGATGPLTLSCSTNGFTEMKAFKTALKDVGVNLQFRKPKTAGLLLPTGGPATPSAQ